MQVDVIIAKAAIRAPLFDPLDEIKKKFEWVLETEERCLMKKATVRERMDRWVECLAVVLPWQEAHPDLASFSSIAVVVAGACKC